MVAWLPYFTLVYSHDVAEIAGLISYSFGTEEIDKYTILYKKVTTIIISNDNVNNMLQEYPPSEQELHKLKYGEVIILLE